MDFGSGPKSAPENRVWEPRRAMLEEEEVWREKAAMGVW